MDTTNIFTVTPMNQDVELRPGQVYTGSITVANPANAANDFHYKVTVSPYGVVGEEYTADLETTSTRSQMVDWIKIDNPTGVLKPNETTKVNFTINVPKTAPAGGQYAALLVSSANNNAANNGFTINNIFEMASLVYAKVAGETTRGGEVKEIAIPGFVTAAPIATRAVLTNEGNVHETARIALEVRNVFSATPIYPTAGENGILTETIMPETTRLITRNIDGISPVGIYEVKETINYLGQNTMASKIVIACPIWFMVLTLVTITAAVVAIVRGVRAHRLKRKVF